jgi:hypothetical protein
MRHVRGLNARSVALGGAVVAIAAVLRGRYLRWGATDHELVARLPGDEIVPHADLTATRAVTIRATAGEVWPWIVQLGQGRGGFYSYDFLENLIGCDIHSAEEIVAAWQHVDVGDPVHFYPGGGPRVAVVDPERALVLSGGIPIGAEPPPYTFSWAFVLLPAPNGEARLVVRERYGYLHRWAALLVEPVEAVSFLMSRRMLHGIKQRAERTAVPDASIHTGQTTRTAGERSVLPPPTPLRVPSPTKER